MKNEWINVKDRLPDDVEDKEIKLADNSKQIGYLSPHNKVWCSALPIQVKGTVTHWRDKGGFDSLDVFTRNT